MEARVGWVGDAAAMEARCVMEKRGHGENNEGEDALRLARRCTCGSASEFFLPLSLSLLCIRRRTP
jgi:hypothetical protein